MEYTNITIPPLNGESGLAHETKRKQRIQESINKEIDISQVTRSDDLELLASDFSVCESEHLCVTSHITDDRATFCMHVLGQLRK